MRENILSIQSVHSLNFNHIWVDSSASVIHFPINRINHLPSIGGDKHTQYSQYSAIKYYPPFIYEWIVWLLMVSVMYMGNAA